MPKSEEKIKIEISGKLHKRIVAFKEVVEVLMDEKYEMDNFVAGLFDNGIDLLLEKLLVNVAPETLLQSLQQLGTKYPVEVYGHIAETLRRGDKINKEGLKKAIGFQASEQQL